MFLQIFLERSSAGVLAAIVCTAGSFGALFGIVPASAAQPTVELPSQRPAKSELVPKIEPPKYASPAETRLRERLSAHLKPMLEANIAPEELTQAAQGLKLIGSGQLEAADLIIGNLKDPNIARVVHWKRLLRAGGTPGNGDAKFLNANPGWPQRDTLQRYYENTLLREGGSAVAIRSFFKKNSPITGAGWAARASAEQALGNTKQARKWAAQAWCHGRIPQSLEANFLARFQSTLTPADHKCRLDRLLIASPRARSIRSSRVSAAKRIVPLLSEPEQLKANARIKVFARRGGLKELRAIVQQPELVKGDWGLAFQRIARSRRLKNYDHAFELLKAVPGDHPGHINRDAWWTERQRHARYWLGKGNTKRAYAIVSGVRPESANPAKEQAFFAGWIALMQLKRPKRARDHFKRMVTYADGPLSKSKSEYWLARAHQKLGNRKLAQTHFKASAKIHDTFHALLSRRALSPKSRRIELPPARLPTEKEVQRFLGNSVVKGLLAAYELKLSRREILSFYRSLGRSLESEAEFALLAQLASLKGDGQGEVRTGKYGVSRGFNLYEFAYPVHHLPTYTPLREPVEPALLLAIARQESEFNSRIVSRAGARGVLQVMPITARHICRQYRIKCRLRDLLSKPSYNARIASAYVADRRDEFAGSYILTLTGFNAGPGRTRQWLRQMGDPRRAKVDPLDWIYRIPFEETRLYVRKVLSNVQIYRARLGEKQPLRLDKDLRRGQS